MLIVRFLQDYQHTERRTWHTGDEPTIDAALARSLKQQGIVEIISPGCGCPGGEAEARVAALLATRGITQDEIDEANEAAQAAEETEALADAIARKVKQGGRPLKKRKK